jgi:RNA polymerase sigma factor (TIGR02999 family)
MSDVTQILSQIEDGDGQAAEKLLPLVYDELRKLAAEKMAHEKPGQTLQATALVHEAYIRLVASPEQRWENRRHFFLAAAEVMRRLLIENARRKGRTRHGGSLQRVDLADIPLEISWETKLPREDVLAVDDALCHLEAVDSQAAELVKLRFFSGLTLDEAAETLGISRRTANRDWAFARAWLYHHLGGKGRTPAE